MGKIFYKGVDYSSPTSSGVSGVKGNKETAYRVGNVNITPANVGALAENGDSKDNTVTFTSNDTSTSDAWTDVAVLATGEKHSSLFAKISTMFKNIRYIYTHFIKSENILETLEEIVANTQSGKVAGALAVKELNSNLGNNFIIKQYQIDKTIYANDTSNLYDIPMIDGYKLLSCNIEYLTVTSNKIIISSPIRIYQSNTYRVVAYNLSPASNTLKGSLYVMFVKNDYIK